MPDSKNDKDRIKPALLVNKSDSKFIQLDYSAGKRDRGKKHPLLPGAKPPDSIEQEAQPPVQGKAVLKVGFKVENLPALLYMIM